MVRAELSKLWSLRATYAILLGSVLVSLAGAAFSASGRAHDWAGMTAAEHRAFDPVNLSFDGLAFAQLGFAVLGGLCYADEYTYRIVDATYLTMPRRRRVLAVKCAVLAGVTLVIGELLCLAAFLIAQACLGEHGVSLASSGALRAVVLAGIYLTALTLIGVAVGAWLRGVAATISVLVGVVFLLPFVTPSLRGWSNWPDKSTLWSAANSFIATKPLGDTSPSLSLAGVVVASYLAAALAAAGVAVSRDV